MRPEQKIRAGRWNERVRLAATFLNIIAVGTFGLAVTSPLLEHLRFDDGAFMGLAKVGEGLDLPWYEFVYWPFPLGALILHALAHILLGVLDPEE